MGGQNSPSTNHINGQIVIITGGIHENKHLKS